MLKPHKIYSDTIEGKALAQFHEALKQDCVVQGALMPDAHAGYTLPIGAVIATDGVVFPSAVGYDIGCGVLGIPTTFKVDEVREHAKAIFDHIYRDVPVGFSHHASAQDWTYRGPTTHVVRKILEDGGLRQLGTLGGGNHFIEIGHDERDKVWVVIHSGSRNIGHSIAKHYMIAAAGDGRAREGFYGLKVTSDAGRDYLMDMEFGLEFALANRLSIAHRVEAAVARFVDGKADYSALINRNHNHAEMNRDGLWICRKGATHAEDGMMGVIPGSMRDGSFIVRGKGNPESLCSSSHGAGRVMGRKEAKASLDMETFRKEMAERGIQARVEEATLDESAGAYKNVFEVMAMQRDLVDVVHHIKPLINIKG